MTGSSPTSFGSLIMADDPLTVGPEFLSKRVGLQRGFYGAASLEEVGLVMAMTCPLYLRMDCTMVARFLFLLISMAFYFIYLVHFKYVTEKKIIFHLQKNYRSKLVTLKKQ
ncbi:dirigent protein 19 [Phtheirospermum japonicum]|uniref:Dirigent protein n=1 Tax=Phtheirospermum japonicum TaxID=374723 RepID=A0A830D6M0_9LAMI|nr:dirigent protein 19 [Phtheirospermum japonicum]